MASILQKSLVNYNFLVSLIREARTKGYSQRQLGGGASLDTIFRKATIPAGLYTFRGLSC